MHDEILSTKGCSACDRFAAENGVPTRRLMAQAGRAVADAIRRRWAPRRAVVLCGPGNNGGDGFVCARHLADAGWPIRLGLLGETAGLTGDAAWAAAQWAGPVEPVGPALLEGAGLIVDALFGAGLSRPLDGIAAELTGTMAAAGVPVVAVDLPSGISGDAARPLGPAASAALTVTFHRCKPAHRLEPAATLCGEVVLADIGIPAGWQSAAQPVARLNGPELWFGALPGAAADDHKHARGRLAVFTGPASSTGAARLAARAGLRIGAGLVSLASPPGALLVNAAASTAVMVRRWAGPEETGEVLDALRADAAVIGPALGVGEAACETVVNAAARSAHLVLDADALSSFADAPDRLFAALRPGDVLTPHEGEFRRLFPDLAPETGNRIERTAKAAERAGCTLVLKGADTTIAAPGRTPVINRHASPALATAGTGDVLAGLTGGLVARGMDGFHAACAAVWLHGDAALHLGEGLIAEDLPEAIPGRLQALRRCRQRQALAGHVFPHGS
jgi:NAD(P)H-hydrate epimerase